MNLPLSRYLLLGVLTLGLATSLYGQSSKVKKAINTFNGGKIDKGIDLMETALRNDPSDENWEVLVSMYSERYDIACDLFAQREAATEEKQPLPKAYTHPDDCFSDLVKVCREAGLNAWCPVAAQLLRQFFIDPPVDTLVAPTALEAFEQAEIHFAEEEYPKAIERYHKARHLQPDYYAATLYLGEAFWYQKNTDSALHYFQQATEISPTALDPRIYTTEALIEQKKFSEAQSVCWEALLLYPEPALFDAYAAIIEQEGKKFDAHWIPRGSEVNAIGGEQNKAIDQVWAVYHKAKNKIVPYCDENGIITQKNDLTQARYLEVYCWEQMLTKTKDLPKDLNFAKKMHKAGYLDCYVLFCMFHYDLYPQYRHFVGENEGRLREFVAGYLVR